MWKLLRVLPKFASVWKKSSATDFAQARNLPFPAGPVPKFLKFDRVGWFCLDFTFFIDLSVRRAFGSLASGKLSARLYN